MLFESKVIIGCLYTEERISVVLSLKKQQQLLVKNQNFLFSF